jgi:hypothetical protein
VDPIHAIYSNARAFAVDVVDQELAYKDGCIGIAFTNAIDHFAGADGNPGNSGDGEGAEEGEIFAGEEGPGTFVETLDLC